MSRRHARILVTGGTATIEDLGSKNGNYLNGQLVKGATTLDDGSQVRIGPVTIVYQRTGALPSTRDPAAAQGLIYARRRQKVESRC